MLDTLLLGVIICLGVIQCRSDPHFRNEKRYFEQTQPNPDPLPTQPEPQPDHEPQPQPEPQPDQLTCFSCPPGSMSTPACRINISNVGNSSLCPPGFCWTFNPLNCTLCSPGTFQPHPEQDRCVPCGHGFYQPSNGSSTCMKCPQGNFCPSPTTANPIVCPNGTYCPGECLFAPAPCPGGYYCPNNATVVPIPCDAGYYCPTASAVPIPCPSGTYCPVATVYPLYCPPLFVSAAFADSCNPSTAFYIVVPVSVVVGSVCASLVGWHLMQKKKKQLSEDKSNEIKHLIPRADGPQYSGL